MKRCLPALLIAATTLVSACGFHLRGSGDAAHLSVPELSLSTRNTYDNLTTSVRRMLEEGGVRVVPGAGYKLVLGDLQETRRTASYTLNTRSAEYELTSRLPFEIRSKDDVLLLNDTLEVQKTVVNDESNLAGSDQEQDQLRNEMRRELVLQLQGRLQQLSVERLNELNLRGHSATGGQPVR